MGFLALLFILPATTFAADLFSSDAPLVLELKSDFKSLLALPESEEKSFVVQVTAGENIFTAELQPRGRMRRDACKELPPMKLILPKGKENRHPPFEDIDRDLKIVTSCYPTLTSEEMKFALYREYFQYKLLNAAGFTSFRVRLAEITYRDSSGEIYSQTPAFFIENIKDLAKRYKLGKKTPAPGRFELQAELLVAENFIENYDFFVPNIDSENNHNVKTLSNAKNQLIAMVPFDFDLSFISRGGLLPDAANIAANFQTLGPPGAKQQILKQLLQLTEKKSELLAEIEKSPLPEGERQPLRQWIADYMQAIQIYQNVSAPSQH